MDNVGKHSFVTIKYNDNICLVRALVLAQARLKHLKDVRNETKYFYNTVRDAWWSFQKLLAEKLIREAGVWVPSDGCGYLEIQKFEEYFDKLSIAIVLFDSRDFGNGAEILFDGRKESTPGVF